MKKCYKCKVEKEFDKFSKNKRNNDGFQNICKICKKEEDRILYLKNPQQTKDRNKRYIKKIREWWEIYRLTLKCSLCSENRFWCLDFHHLDPSKKDYNIADLLKGGFSVKKIMNEINKCICVCSNCHRDIHHKIRNNIN